jgi:hypothetical protein
MSNPPFPPMQIFAMSRYKRKNLEKKNTLLFLNVFHAVCNRMLIIDYKVYLFLCAMCHFLYCGNLPWEPPTGDQNRYRNNRSINRITVVTNSRNNRNCYERLPPAVLLKTSTRTVQLPRRRAPVQTPAADMIFKVQLSLRKENVLLV